MMITTSFHQPWTLKPPNLPNESYKTHHKTLHRPTPSSSSISLTHIKPDHSLQTKLQHAEISKSLSIQHKPPRRKKKTTPSSSTTSTKTISNKNAEPTLMNTSSSDQHFKFLLNELPNHGSNLTNSPGQYHHDDGIQQCHITDGLSLSLSTKPTHNKLPSTYLSNTCIYSDAEYLGLDATILANDHACTSMDATLMDTITTRQLLELDGSLYGGSPKLSKSNGTTTTDNAKIFIYFSDFCAQLITNLMNINYFYLDFTNSLK